MQFHISKTSWSNTPAGTKCDYCKECNGSGTCANVSNKETFPPSCIKCKWCVNGACDNVPQNQDPKNDCVADDVQTCGHNGNCDGKGECDIWSPYDSTGQVSDGSICTSPDYCLNGAKTGQTVPLPMHCGGMMGVPGIFSACSFGGACGACQPFILMPNYAPCEPGYECCGGSCKPQCCTDNQCPAGQTCGWHYPGGYVGNRYWGCG